MVEWKHRHSCHTVCLQSGMSWYCDRHAARAEHKTIAHTKTISGGYSSRQRGDGGWNTKTFEHRHFAVEMWKSKCLSDSVTTSPLNWEVDSELFGSVGGEALLEYEARKYFWTGLFWEVAINYWHGYPDQIVVRTRPRSWMSTQLSTVWCLPRFTREHRGMMARWREVAMITAGWNFKYLDI